MATSKFNKVVKKNNITYTNLNMRNATNGFKTRKHAYRYAKKSLVGGSAISASSAKVVYSPYSKDINYHIQNVKKLLQKLIPSVPTVTDGINYNTPIVLINNNKPISLSIYAFIILYCMIEFNFKINTDNENNIILLNAENISIIINDRTDSASIINYMYYIGLLINTSVIVSNAISSENYYDINTFRLLYGFLQQFFTKLPVGHHLSEYINIIPGDIHTQQREPLQAIKSINISNVPVPYYPAPLDNKCSYCSLNVVIQMLWAIGMFRECIINLDNIYSIETYCKKLQSINMPEDLNDNLGYTNTTSYICMLALCKLFRDYHFKELITVKRIDEYKSLKTVRTQLLENATAILKKYNSILDNPQYIKANNATQTQIETNETERSKFEIQYHQLYITIIDIPTEYIVGLQTGNVIPTVASKKKISLLYVLRRLICDNSEQFINKGNIKQPNYTDHFMNIDTPNIILDKVISHFANCDQTKTLSTTIALYDITDETSELQFAVNKVASAQGYNYATHKILLITRHLSNDSPQLQSDKPVDITTNLSINDASPLYYLKGIIYFQGNIDPFKSGHWVFIKYKYNNDTKSSEMYCYISDSEIEYASEMTDHRKQDISTQVSTRWVIMLFTQDLT